MNNLRHNVNIVNCGEFLIFQCWVFEVLLLASLNIHWGLVSKEIELMVLVGSCYVVYLSIL